MTGPRFILHADDLYGEMDLDCETPEPEDLPGW